MPRYYFHIRGGPEAAEDLLGTELPDNPAARTYAERLARDLSAEEVVEGEPATEARLEVEDEERRPLFTLPHLSEAASER